MIEKNLLHSIKFSFKSIVANPVKTERFWGNESEI